MSKNVAEQRALNAETVPENVKELISRRVKAREKYRHIRTEQVAGGQVWRVKPVDPIYDTITGEPIAVTVFLMEPATDSAMKGWWYGFLTQRKEPDLEKPLLRWQFNPYMEMAVDAFHRDWKWEESDPTADFLLHEAPVFVHVEHLVHVVADFGKESVASVREHMGFWLSSGGPNTAMNATTEIGGYDFMEIACRITQAYNEELAEIIED